MPFILLWRCCRQCFVTPSGVWCCRQCFVHDDTNFTLDAVMHPEGDSTYLLSLETSREGDEALARVPSSFQVTVAHWLWAHLLSGTLAVDQSVLWSRRWNHTPCGLRDVCSYSRVFSFGVLSFGVFSFGVLSFGVLSIWCTLIWCTLNCWTLKRFTLLYYGSL